MVILVFFLVVSFIIQPLFTRRMSSPSQEEDTSQSLKLRKRVIYQQIKEAEMEYEMGNLSKEDFFRIRNQLKQEASKLIEKEKGLG